MAKDADAADARRLRGLHRRDGPGGRPGHRHDVRLEGRTRRRDDRPAQRPAAGRPAPARPARQVVQGLPGRRRRACGSPTARSRPSSPPRVCPRGAGGSAPRAARTSDAARHDGRGAVGRAPGRLARGQPHRGQRSMLGGGGRSTRCSPRASRPTGLQLPEDIETLLGDGVSRLRRRRHGPEGAHRVAGPEHRSPPGIRIQGDPAKITPIIDKLKAAAGPGGRPRQGRHRRRRGRGRHSTRTTSSQLHDERRPRQRRGVRGRRARGRPRPRGASTSTSTPATAGPSSSPTWSPTATPEVEGEHRAARRARGQRLGRRRRGPARACSG